MPTGKGKTKSIFSKSNRSRIKLFNVSLFDVIAIYNKNIK